MALRLEINKKWLEKNGEKVTQEYLKKYPAETDLTKTHFVIEFPYEQFHFNEYDGKEVINISNYSEDFKGAFYVDIEMKPSSEEWGLLATYLVKMYNKLKNIIESV